MEYGELLRTYRERRGLNIAQLAQKTNASSAYISQIEYGKRKAPEYKLCVKIAEVLNLSSDEKYHFVMYSLKEKLNIDDISEIYSIFGVPKTKKENIVEYILPFDYNNFTKGDIVECDTNAGYQSKDIVYVRTKNGDVYLRRVYIDVENQLLLLNSQDKDDNSPPINIQMKNIDICYKVIGLRKNDYL